MTGSSEPAFVVGTRLVSDEHQSLAAGMVLHQTYVLEGLLGRGGMGAVWRARHLRLPRAVAVKVLHEQAYESAELLQRFRREAEITSQLGHPHIVEVFDFNVLEDGRAYLVMELLEGESLRDRLRRAPALDLEAIHVILEQVASALAHAHRAGVVHRDLKPENVFLVAVEADRPFAKVLDFGISKMQGAHTVLTHGPSLMGTPRYMAPEQAKGEHDRVDGRADQFSLGAIAYEMLSGKPAFGGTTVTEVLLQVLQQEPRPLAEVAPGLPEGLTTSVMRALAKERDQRFADLDDFRAVLLEGVTGARLEGAAVHGSEMPVARGALPEAGWAHTDPDPFDDTLRRPREKGTADALVSKGDAPSDGARPDSVSRPVKGPWFNARRAAVGLVLVVGLTGGLFLGLRPGDSEGFGNELVEAPGLKGEPVSIVRPPDAGLSDGGFNDLGLRFDGGTSASPAVDAGPPQAKGEAPPRRTPIRPRARPPRLQGAEQALVAGRYAEAIRLARRSLREEDDDRAYASLAIAHCGLRDLGAARAMFRRTPNRSRGRVRRACRRLGMSL